jgi:hypothetical protein
MKTKILIYALMLIGIVLLVFSVVIVFYSNSKLPNALCGNKLSNDNEPPTLEDLMAEGLMAIVKKSPDYPDFLKIIKSDSFDAELVEYYNFSPEVYNKSMAEWESTSNTMKEYKEVFDKVQLNDNSFFVRFKSKSNPKNGLVAILDMGNKTPQVIVGTIVVEAAVGL